MDFRKPAQPSVASTTYHAKTLAIESIDNVTVEVGSGPDCTVTIDGPPEDAKHFRHFLKGDVLTVWSDQDQLRRPNSVTVVSAGRRSYFRGHQSIVSVSNIRGGVISVGDNIVVMNGQVVDGGSNTVPLTPPTNVTITVPAGIAIIARGDCDNLEIGDTNGPFNLNMSGSGDVLVGSVGPMSASLAGSGDLRVKSITGSLDITRQGSTDVNVRRVDGNVTLRLKGTGDITIDSLIGGLDVEKDGVGDIDINDGFISDFKLRLTGVSNVMIGAYSATADIVSSGVSRVYLTHAGKVLRQETQGLGSLKIKRVG